MRQIIQGLKNENSKTKTKIDLDMKSNNNKKNNEKSEDSDNNNSFSIFKNHDTYITENDLNNNVSKTISANPSNNSRMIRNKIFKINKKSNILNLKKEKCMHVKQWGERIIYVQIKQEH